LNPLNSSDSASEYGFPGLLNINLEIKRREFVIVTGSIGTGKSSLLNAIEGSMLQKSGSLKIYGSLTFCSYPWVQNATIRDNILFGSSYDAKRYNDIVKSCALDVDFQILPEGDLTEVGERGITLSGGQKARINLARAVYADSDVILLDDVLSAVDARVGKHIMEECICGILSKKTRVLATHQLSLIDYADRVIVLDGSGSIDVGTQTELLARNQTFSNLMDYSKESQETEENKDEVIEEEEFKELYQEKSRISNIKSRLDGDEDDDEKQEMGISESRGVNSISFSLYANYLKLGSNLKRRYAVPLFFLTLAINGFLQVFQSVWLTFWISHKFDYSDGLYAGLYVLFVMLATSSFFFLFSTMAWINNKAGLRLFNQSIERLLRTPMSFMDITPIGRILNRFTKDVDVLDTDMIEQLRLFLSSISVVGATIILAGIYIPWFFLSVPITFSLYWGLATYYQASALDLKRLEATKRSFVFSHFNESLSGMKVIKSYGSQERFFKVYERLIDNMNSAYFLTLANQRWLSIRLDSVSSLTALFVSLLCVLRVFELNSSSSGLLVSYMIQVSTMVSLVIRSMTQLENDFNSAERLFEYANELPQEAAFENDDSKPPAEWPVSGSIEFKDVSLRYREGLPLVLKNVNFKVNGGAKIGICGRTGAGKSTIMNALFRVNELATGKVTIDGLDISELGLNDLRSKLSIIPQDPVLFHGTIRQNLDPFGNATDAELWDALRRSWLVDKSASGIGEFHSGSDDLRNFHKFHLDQTVDDDGSNFSLGERQLLALARALVRDSKVLILDEATSSVDYETDSMIQSTIVNEFKECTILCIAHRLKTILNYDLILVLDKGEVAEYDTPHNLFKNGGIFTEMCARSNITEEDFNVVN
jgi:ABC-type multidrug transport system fused ATPase/permease subunit